MGVPKQQSISLYHDYIKKIAVNSIDEYIGFHNELFTAVRTEV